MKKTHLLGAVCAAVFSFATMSSYAALIDRGNGMIYDSDLNVTWLQDANYAQTSGYDTDGLMTWNQALNWASQLNFGGHDDWRLAKVANPFCTNTPYTYPSCTDGELSHMFYSEFGYKHGQLSTLPWYYVINNLKTSSGYWYETIGSVNPSLQAFAFSFNGGDEGQYNMTDRKYAWAVRDGDVATVPIPPALWLFGSGLLGLVGVARK